MLRVIQISKMYLEVVDKVEPYKNVDPRKSSRTFSRLCQLGRESNTNITRNQLFFDYSSQWMNWLSFWRLLFSCPPPLSRPAAGLCRIQCQLVMSLHLAYWHDLAIDWYEILSRKKWSQSPLGQQQYLPAVFHTCVCSWWGKGKECSEKGGEKDWRQMTYSTW